MTSKKIINLPGQVVVGDPCPPADPSAIFTVNGVDRGALLPRLTDAQMYAIVAPATGLIIFNTDQGVFYYFDGTDWLPITSGGGGGPGPRGFSGYSGKSGYSGQDGVIGHDGASGYSGAQGLSGYSGVQGASGFSGYSGGNISVGPTPPPGAQPGDLWWNNDLGILFIYYDDGNTQQWVDAAIGGGGVGAVPPARPVLQVLAAQARLVPRAQTVLLVQQAQTAMSKARLVLKACKVFKACKASSVLQGRRARQGLPDQPVLQATAVHQDIQASPVLQASPAGQATAVNQVLLGPRATQAFQASADTQVSARLATQALWDLRVLQATQG